MNEMSSYDSVQGYMALKEQFQDVIRNTEATVLRKDLSEDQIERAKEGMMTLLKTLTGLQVLPCAKLIASYSGNIIELKAYNCDPKRLAKNIEGIHGGLLPSDMILEEGFLRIINTEKLDINYDVMSVLKYGTRSGAFYNELIQKPQYKKMLGIDTKDVRTFIYNEIYNSISPFFIDMSPSRPTREDTINAIHDSGGYAFLASPGSYAKEMDLKNEIEYGTLLEGIDGVEVYHPSHDEKMQEYLLEKCKEKDLKISGVKEDGTVDMPYIEGTEWIKEAIRDGKYYLSEAIRDDNLGKRLIAIIKGDKIEER